MAVRAVVYARQSVDAEQGIERQVADCRAYAVAHGLQVVAEYVDNDASAAPGKKPRPRFEAMLAALADGGAAALVVTEPSRLLRSLRDRVRVVEVGRAQGLQVHTVRGGVDDYGTAAGRLKAGIVAEVAQHEIEQKAERQLRANRQRVEQGKVVTMGHRPFGWEWDGSTRGSRTCSRMVVNEAERVVLARMYRWLLDGVPQVEIARRLNDEGVPTGRGAAWSQAAVRKVLLRPANVARRVYQGVTYAAEWAPLVDAEVYEAAVELLGGRRGWRKHLLSGLLLCGVCGKALHAGVNNGATVYRCTPTGHVARRAGWIDEAVAAAVCWRLARPDAVGLLAGGDDAAAARAEVARLERKITEYSELYEADVLDVRMYTARCKAVNGDLRRARARLARHTSQGVLAPLVARDAAKVRAVWDGMPLAQQRQVVELLMVVTLHPAARPGSSKPDYEALKVQWKQEAE